MAGDTRGEKGLPRAAIIGVVVVAVIVVVAVVMSQKQRYTLMAPGAKAIDFTLPDLEGRKHSLSEMRGNVVFLNFWATWCGPCQDEIPSMQVMHERLRGRPFRIMAVSIDTGSDDVVRKFADGYGISFLVLRDRDGRIKDAYKTTGVPETFIIDQNGYVAEKVWGPRDWSNPLYLKTVRDLLDNGPRDPASYGKKARGRRGAPAYGAGKPGK